ncbi:MAG: endonuclease MutS2 [Bryobacteraceae bacterium]
MKATSAGILEFAALKELVGRYVSSPAGRAEMEKLAPDSGREAIEGALADAAEAARYVQTKAGPPLNFGSLPDLSLAVRKLHIEGAGLDPEEIVHLLQFLDLAADSKSNLTAAAGRFPKLGERGRRLGDFTQLLKDLRGKILPDGTVPDDASVALARIRREIEKQRKAIQSSLERFLRAHRDEGVLQEDFVAIRNDRFVVPVVAGQRGRIGGVIHGASSSGQTLFVEPLETIELNNDLVRLTEDEMREVHRILRELTARLRQQAAEIHATLAEIGALDLIFAKGRFAVDFRCSTPRFGERLLLREARHPLLEDVLRRQRKPVVPISLELDAKCRTLLISGPNTGGKTVSLKTVGLLALMAHAGLPVPAEEAEFPVFDQVLADIGDNQSIQENLSTFSAHISRIREMILDVTPDSLVLLDEIGAATDPEEGGALGVAVVDHFRAAGAYTLVSTHLAALKIYGSSTPAVLNASMGYDEETLQPTYQLRVGLPGKSAGLDIATRLGMPSHVIERARAALTGREEEAARYIAGLHARLEEIERIQKGLQEKEAELGRREERIASDAEKREAARAREFELQAEQALRGFEQRARETIEKIAASVGQRKAAEKAGREIAKIGRELREQVASVLRPTEAGGAPPAIPKVEEGARVRLNGVREPARVRRLLNDGRLEVEAGFLRMQVTVDDVLEVLPESQPAGSRLPANVSYKPAPRLNPAVREINVIGERAEEACDRVEKFLDEAVMATASRVRIVHGHGRGILRKAISGLLGASPHVEKFYPASPQEGGAGATIVELKE